MLPQALASIVIPNYNHAAYVGDAISSVLKQDYPNCEIIVVDDGSTDESRSVIARFGDHVRTIRQENQGLSAARNSGIQAANGAYIGVLDADDMYESDFLSVLVTLLESAPEVDGIYCGYQFVDDQNALLPQREARLVAHDQLYCALLDGNFLVPEAVLVRRHCYTQAGLFDRTLTALEDWDMWLRIARDFTLVGTDRLLVRHRILPNSMSTDPTRMHLNRLKVLEKQVGAEPDSPSDANVHIQRAYGRTYLVSCIEYLQVSDRERAYACLRKMAMIYPDLLLELDTFYLLGCGSQPKGWMGDFDSLDLEGNASTLIGMLQRLFGESHLRPALDRCERTAFANAYLAFGLLNYGARSYPASRRYLLRGLLANPRTGLTQRTLATMTKSLPVANRLLRHRSSKSSGEST